jgi:hypothetical protein
LQALEGMPDGKSVVVEINPVTRVVYRHRKPYLTAFYTTYVLLETTDGGPTGIINRYMNCCI